MTVQLTVNQTSLKSLRSLVCRLAYRLAQGGLSTSASMRWSWAAAKLMPELGIFELQKIVTLSRNYWKIVNDEDIAIEEALCIGYDFVINQRWEREISVVTFIKSDGAIVTKVVDKNWAATHEVKGTGRPLKAGQVIFTDLSKTLAGVSWDTVSTYTDRILFDSSLKR